MASIHEIHPKTNKLQLQSEMVFETSGKKKIVEIALRVGRSIYMDDIYVKPEYRGKGIGKLPWKACVKVK